jgi:predicted dehydrogenase
MMMRISLVGCGRWGRNILRDLLSLGMEVRVADPDPEARQRALAAGAAATANALEDLPASDGIVIAATTAMHAGVIACALACDVPVFVEKPMTNNARAARELAGRAQGRLFVMDKWRYHPGIEELRRVRESGELGRPFGMRILFEGWGMPHRDVGAPWILMPHCLSSFLEVFGQLPPARQAFAESLDGETVALSGSLGEEPWAHFETSIRAPRKRREFRLHCEGGVAWLDDGWSGHIQIARGSAGSGGDAPTVERREVSTELPLLRELRAFLDHLKGGPPPRSSAEEGALIVERIQELHRLAGVLP